MTPCRRALITPPSSGMRRIGTAWIIRTTAGAVCGRRGGLRPARTATEHSQSSRPRTSQATRRNLARYRVGTATGARTGNGVTSTTMSVSTGLRRDLRKIVTTSSRLLPRSRRIRHRGLACRTRTTGLTRGPKRLQPRHARTSYRILCALCST